MTLKFHTFSLFCICFTGTISTCCWTIVCFYLLNKEHLQLQRYIFIYVYLASDAICVRKLKNNIPDNKWQLQNATFDLNKFTNGNVKKENVYITKINCTKCVFIVLYSLLYSNLNICSAPKALYQKY